MGSQLSAMAPSQIHPVEYYLADLSTNEPLSFDTNLGSTRFFKVARVKLLQTRPAAGTSSKSGQMLTYAGFGPPSLGVAKVFVINDPSLPLKLYKEKLTHLSNLLEENCSALAFSRILLNEKSAVLLRQYIKYNLYDRLSTRPYLTFFEKKWISFQLLKCFQWCHQRGINHGDVKLENILITSFNWILVTDFAPYKPTKVPEDNPSDFSFYFDTSRRRCCNLAPERFTTDDSVADAGSLGDDELKPQMDLFSIGCVLAELFAESNDFFLFDLSAILMYRKGYEGNVSKLETVIHDESIRKMILNLIEVDPDLRYSTTQHLKSLIPQVFPEYFCDIFEYFKNLITFSSDGKILKMKQDLPSMIEKIKKEDSNGFLLFLVVTTSTLRSLKHVEAKIAALNLIYSLVEADAEVMPTFVIDRVLPYLLFMMRDSNSRIRKEAIDIMTSTLSLVNEVPSGDSNIFTDFIIPSLDRVTNDKSVTVRVALAGNLSKLAGIASRFFFQHKLMLSESQEKLLKDSFSGIISSLFTDSSNAVKRTLLSSNISQLCVFLGKTKSNDVILSHIITFLNDKFDQELRNSFFDHIVSIVSYLGESTSSILKPLLSQGLVDTCESVVVKTINAMASLASLKVLDKSVIFELVSESAPYLYHPSHWVVSAEVNFITSFNLNLTLAEVNCKLMPIVNKYLKKEIHILDEQVLHYSLNPPISRSMFNLLTSSHTPYEQLETLFVELMNRRLMASLPPHNQRHTRNVPKPSPPSVLYQRLVAEGMTQEIEERLWAMGDLIMRINKNLRSSVKRNKNDESNETVIQLSEARRRINVCNLIDEDKLVKTRIRSMTSDMNNEWRQMFGSTTITISDREDGSSRDGDSGSGILDEGIIIPVASEAREVSDDIDNGAVKCPPCIGTLKELIDHKKDEYEVFLWSRGVDGSTSGYPSDPKNGYTCHHNFKPKGCLVAHLHEHSKGVNQLITIQGTPFVASCSSDGYIKTWDTQKIESGRLLINKSRQSIASNNLSGFGGMTYCAAVDTLVSYTSSSQIQLFKVDSMSSKLRSTSIHGPAQCNDSGTSITDVTTSTAFSFIAAFSDSTLYDYDLRMGIDEPSWKLTAELQDGYITCITATDYCVFAGTSSGSIYIFDTRFLVRANRIINSDRKRIRRLLYTPLGLFAAMRGNNEVTLYDVETGVKSRTLWASKEPVLSKESNANSVLGMVFVSSSATTSSSQNIVSNALMTCGTDTRIRFWDLDSPHNSYVMCDGMRNEYLTGITHRPNDIFTYEKKITDAIEVIQEHEKPRKEAANTAGNFCIDPNTVSPSHHDCISDMVWVESSKVLVSAAKDGVIKMWK